MDKEENGLLDNLELVLDRLNDGLVLLSMSGKILYINEFLLELGGYDRKDIQGKNVMKLAGVFSAGSLKKIIGSFSKARKGVKSERYEVEANTKKGGKKTLDLSTSLVKNDGRAMGIAVVIRDLSERRNLERLARESTKKYELFFENSADAIFIADGRTRKILDCNKKAESLTGYSRKEILSMSADQLHPPDSVKKTMEKFQEQIQGKLENVAAEILTKAGKRIPVEISSSSMAIEGKIYSVGIFRNMAESRQAEIRYKSLFEVSFDAVMTLEPPFWKFTSGNSAALKIYGIKSEKEFTALGPWDVSPKYQPDGKLSSTKAKEMIQKALDEGFNYFEWTHKKWQGKEFPATVLLSRIVIGDRVIILATVRDIALQKETEKKFQGKVVDLERMNRLMTGRELMMIELKEKIRKLEK